MDYGPSQLRTQAPLLQSAWLHKFAPEDRQPCNLGTCDEIMQACWPNKEQTPNKHQLQSKDVGPADSAGHSKIQPEIIQNPSQNDPISEFGGGLGAHCGQSRLPNLRNSWAVLGASWGRFWGVLEHLEAATGGLEALWVV